MREGKRGARQRQPVSSVVHLAQMIDVVIYCTHGIRSIIKTNGSSSRFLAVLDDLDCPLLDRLGDGRNERDGEG